MSPLLGKSGVVDDPGFDGALAFNRRQDHLAYLAQHLLIRPGAAADEMQQRLMLGGCPFRSRHRRHRLHALATATGHQADAIVAQRRLPISMTDDTGKPFQIRRKSLLARLGATPAHVSLIS
ncbi:hypothetical protein AOQ73_39940 [Bradyrhizobium pachyrhizi]|nr:hypothetical protein AOQ73_39940 [Bradyrhizobium pachyrhizi]